MLVERLILDAEFVDRHGDANHVAVQVFDGHTQDGPRLVASLDVNFIIEPGVLQCKENIQNQSGSVLTGVVQISRNDMKHTDLYKGNFIDLSPFVNVVLCDFG